MTDRIDPSPSSDGQAYMIAQAIRQHGSVGDGWIAASDTAYAADHSNSGLSGAPLNAFVKTTESGLDVTFDTGEAFIGGSWVGRDTTTTISLADNTTDQNVRVGWDYNAADAVKIGVPGASPGATFDAKDPRIPLYTFDTDSGAVSSQTDDRTIGKSHSFSNPTLESGAEIARFLMTAHSDTVQGTAGNSTNEVYRAGTDVSDLVMSVRADGRFNLAWNAYYDGSDWRFIVGYEDAYKLSFGGGSGDDLRLSAADGGAADTVIAWDNEFGVDIFNGWVDKNDNVVYDEPNAEVPHARLASPSGDLSSYPIPAGDIDDGSGSNLDADTVDGYEASELQGGTGEWTQIASHSDTDTTTDVGNTWGPLTTTYEVYRVVGRFTSFHDGSTHTFNECEININNNTNTVYNQANIAGGTGVEAQSNKNGWENLGKVECGVDGDGFFDVVIRGEAFDSTSSENHPTIAARHNAGTYDTWQLANGVMRADITTVDEFRVFSLGEMAGEFYLYGKDL